MTEQEARETRAVALRYFGRDAPEESSAPQVLAKGRGFVAERILELARAHGVPVRADKDLVELLSACDLGDEIPADVYTAVAELLAWLYRSNQALAERDAGSDATAA